MKTIDNTIKYYELLMIYNNTEVFFNYSLPSGYHFEYYKDGDLLDWVNIHICSGEFTSIDSGIKIFHDFYDNFISELDKRCIFIVDDKNKEKVGTVTVSLLSQEEYGCLATVDWLAIKKKYQGKGLAKPLISKTISLANELGHKKILLHTQTTTWLAAKLYLDFGFEPLNVSDDFGWRILKTITNHKKLSSFHKLDNDEIYDKRNIEIEKELISIYGSDKFNYNVWYKDGRHDVEVYYNGFSDVYEYYYNDGKIKLVKK